MNEGLGLKIELDSSEIDVALEKAERLKALLQDAKSLQIGAAGGPLTKWLGDLQRCDVRPGDRFVITTDRALSATEVQYVQDRWCEFIGDGTARPFVIPPAWKVGVLGPEIEAPQA